MAVLYDWCIAPSDEEAAATIDRVGGPGKAVSARRGLFGRERTPELPAYPTVPIELPNGGFVQLRTVMSRSPNTAATIDVNIPGLDITKLKYNP